MALRARVGASPPCRARGRRASSARRRARVGVGVGVCDDDDDDDARAGRRARASSSSIAFDDAHAFVETFAASGLAVRCEPTAHGGEAVVVATSRSARALVGSSDEYDDDDDEYGDADVLSGAAPWRGAKSYACAYGGHQFGQWAGALGDGRCVTLGRVRDARVDVQLKGAGRTPFSRNGDGRAVLRSSIREYVASEAMFALGVPTTRALALVATNAGVVRSTASNASRLEPGAVVTRVAETFVRFGSFQLPWSRRDFATTRKLADFVMDASYGVFSAEELACTRGVDYDDAYGAFVAAVARRTAITVARWQSIGFTHGVLNTDNMSVAGLTIDYGPFGFMEAYDVGYTPNQSDLFGDRMYSFANQPSAVRWNLERFLESCDRLATRKDRARALEIFDEAFSAEIYATFTRKFGVWIRDDDEYEIVRSFHRVLQRGAFDFTLSHRSLGAFASTVLARGESATAPALALDMFASVRRAQDGREDEAMDDALRLQIADFGAMYAEILLRERGDPELIRAAQDSANPLYVPRNYLLQRVIESAERDDFEPLRALCATLEHPYREQPGAERFAQPASVEQHARVGCLS